MANIKFTHFKCPPPFQQKLLLILLPGLSHHSVGNVAKTTHQWQCLLVSYCSMHFGCCKFYTFFTKREYHIPFSSPISNIIPSFTTGKLKLCSLCSRKTSLRPNGNQSKLRKPIQLNINHCISLYINIVSSDNCKNYFTVGWLVK